MIKEWWRKLCPSHKVEGQEQPAADKLRAVRAACFVAMHYPEAVSALLRQYGVDFCVTQAEQRAYLQGGVTPETVYRTIRVHYELILDSLQRIRGIAFREARHRGRAERCTEAMLQHLQQCTAGWTDRVESVPYMAMTDYLPLAAEGTDGKGKGGWKDRKIVWNFKYSTADVTPVSHARSMDLVAAWMADHIRRTFGQDCSQLTFFCIPASDRTVQWKRFREFSHLVCERTGMQDSFDRVFVGLGRMPVHLGGMPGCNYRLDSSWFDGRAVVVFDDIITTGRSLIQARDMLRERGAVTVAAYFIGRTVRTGDFLK